VNGGKSIDPIFTGKKVLGSPAQHQLNIFNNVVKMLSDPLRRKIILSFINSFDPVWVQGRAALNLRY
jgi:hypothetical protein